MKSLKLSNSNLTVTLDDEDYEWSSKFDWSVSQSNNYIKVTRTSITGRTYNLLRGVAIAVLGEEVVNKDCSVLNQSPNPLDMRRKFIVIKTQIRLVDNK